MCTHIFGPNFQEKIFHLNFSIWLFMFFIFDTYFCIVKDIILCVDIVIDKIFNGGFFIMQNIAIYFLISFFKDFIYLREGEGGRRKRERNIKVQLPLACPVLGPWPATQACTLTENWTGNPLVHWPALDPLSHTSQGQNIINY